ncbi:Uncharacterised protein [Mycobacteroides abscessus subsp. abscessus]|nr:Uncharacterised protein [Mycobacteroides abscessus subsp. abscessus]SHS10380.1 Uncharacterised protein [Mycobacteroides abscessus subsp. abscessus]SHT95705.1 Uncharacterised protein [Mycobacteroides abscessus subsp. abscessus]
MFADIIARHCRSHRIDIAPDDCRRDAIKGRKLCPDRARDIVHHQAGQPGGPMSGHRGRGGLLQGVIGEQPVVNAAQLGCRLAAQLHRLRQNCCVITEFVAQGRRVGHQGARRERIRGGPGQVCGARLRRQVCDVGEIEHRQLSEDQDGLIPVIITL